MEAADAQMQSFLGLPANLSPDSQKQQEEEPMGVVRGRALKASRTSSTSQAQLSRDSSINTSALKKIYVMQAHPDKLGKVFQRASPEVSRTYGTLQVSLPSSPQAIVESKLLNLKDQKDRLFFTKMVKYIGTFPLEDLGFNSSLEANLIRNPASLLKLEKLAATEFPSSRIFDFCEGSFFTFPYQNEQTQMLSFPSITHVSERMFMDRCKELAQGKHAWVLNHLPDIIWSFDIPFRAGSPQDNLEKKFGKA
ncbi:hypothetical protein F5890DRAFT_1597743 [Lentinula detonsa]|uniref:Uncharacterized protein n=1 Tax=Lentinula detonsa TaxID=2804962 RepID=A0AA38PXF9_9AGAR|nr:hypothetical protein F5890DRAFT_1597743 [Lentinula detonsa]